MVTPDKGIGIHEVFEFHVNMKPLSENRVRPGEYCSKKADLVDEILKDYTACETTLQAFES